MKIFLLNPFLVPLKEKTAQKIPYPHLKLLLHDTVFQLSTYCNLIHLFLLNILAHSELDWLNILQLQLQYIISNLH